jgi:hypothetical protein
MTNKQNWKVEDVTGALEDCKSFDILLNDRFVATTSSKKMAWRIVNALKNSTSQVNTGTNALDVLAAVERIRGSMKVLELRRSPEYQEVHSQLTGLIIELRQQAKER